MKRLFFGFLSGIFLFSTFSFSYAANTTNEDTLSARDAVRYSDLHDFSVGMEMFWMDHDGQYPSNANELKGSGWYMQNGIPIEPLFGKKGALSACKKGYVYEVYSQGGVKNAWYKLSSCVESKTGKVKAKNDGGSNPNLYELKGESSTSQSSVKKLLKRIYINQIK